MYGVAASTLAAEIDGVAASANTTASSATVALERLTAPRRMARSSTRRRR
jgi:hypothetical protein